MRVIEKFISINGEGMKQGELAIFIRLEGCNLRCAYCDTTYSFINAKYSNETVEEIVAYCIESGIKNVTLTGGEPLIHDDVEELIKELYKNNFNIEVETNGSVDISKYKDLDKISFTLDYKTSCSKMDKFMNFDNYKYLKRIDSIKFVCASHDDLVESLNIINKYQLIGKCNLIFSPVWGEIKLEDIVEFMKANKLNECKMQLQIHKIIWDKDTKGV